MTDDDKAMIEFERHWWKHAGAKVAAIRERFGLGATNYYQRLNRLIDTQEALAFDPVTVNRLRRLRSAWVRSSSLR